MSIYREHIQSLARETWGAYDKAQYLRDAATTAEKDAWNAYRKTMYQAAQILEKLDNSLSDDRATLPLRPLPVE